MINYTMFLDKKVRVITVVFYLNGRKIKTEYIGYLIKQNENYIKILESDGSSVVVKKKFIKRIEETK